MNVTVKIFILLVLMVLLTICVYMTVFNSKLSSSALKILPQRVFTTIVDVNVSSSLRDQLNRTLDTKSSFINFSSNTSPTLTYYFTPSRFRQGRLGNQMFKYASLMGIALTQGRKLAIPSGSELEMTFKLSYVEDNPDVNEWIDIQETHWLDFDAALLCLPKRNWRVGGYLQSRYYFSSVEEEIRREFQFRDSIAIAAARIVRSVHSKYPGFLLIGAHVRRGDFLYKSNDVNAVPEISYFMKAFQWMRLKFPHRSLIFLVASDDHDWVTDNLAAKDVLIIPPDSPGVHMAVLSSCEHMVISGGTFSWWGGWMTGGSVVYFSDYMVKANDKFVPSDYYPPSWVGLRN